MDYKLEQHTKLMKKKNSQKIKLDSYPDLAKPVDEWLWISWKKFRNRLISRKKRTANLQKTRLRVKLSTRKYREKTRNNLIRAIYWHEVYHPTIPIRQFK